MPEKRPARKTPTARTLEELRRREWPGQVVEKWVTMRGEADRLKEEARDRLASMVARIEEGLPPYSPTYGEFPRDFHDAIETLFKPAPAVRKDFLGCIDILALDGCPGSLGIQACAGGDASKRAKKASEEPLLKLWLAAGNRFQVWSWREIWVETGAKTKAKRWRPRVVCLVLVDGEIVDMELEAGSGERVSGALPGAGVGARAAIPPPGPDRSGPALGLFDREDGL